MPPPISAVEPLVSAPSPASRTTILESSSSYVSASTSPAPSSIWTSSMLAGGCGHAAEYAHDQRQMKSVLKEEIGLLKVEPNESEGNISDEDAIAMSEKITQMEEQLGLLRIAMDNKIRFSQRHGSAAGMVIASPPTNFVADLL